MTKDDLTERFRGKGGTPVRLLVDKTLGDAFTYPAGTALVVKDLFTRKNYNKPGHVGVGPVDRGIAFDVTLDQIEVIS